MLFICGTIYVMFADSTLQSWNQPKTKIDSTKDKEMHIIRNEAPTYLVPLKESDECWTCTKTWYQWNMKCNNLETIWSNKLLS